MIFNQIILYVMSVCIILGAFDYSRGNKWGLGKPFEDGLNSFGALFIMMGGVLAIAPLVQVFLAPIVTPVFKVVGIDPGVFPGMVLANDSGAYFLAQAMAENPLAADFGGMLLGSVMGVNLIFNIPVALGMIPEQDRGDMALGFLFGFIALPVGCFLGALAARLPFGFLMRQMIPVIIISVLIGVLLILIPKQLIKIFVWLGKIVTILALGGIVLAVVAKLSGFDHKLQLDKVDNCIAIVGSVVIVLPGAYVLVAILSRSLRKLLAGIGNCLGINESAVLGIISSFANTIPTFALVKDMDRKGKVINFAIATSSSFAFADQLAFCVGVAPRLLLPMLVTKLSGALAAALLVLFYYAYKRKHASSTTIEN
ncbi:MAG: ethanolamine utilization protein EutH [Victivallales bacterium]|nr:ethanolamine utilization protein EutH [Victivallales bacterium]